MLDTKSNIYRPIFHGILRPLRMFRGGGYPVRSPGNFGWSVTGANLSTSYSSRKIKLTGAGVGAIITAQTGSEYSINGGARTSASGTISDDDIIQCFHTSSGSYETLVTGGVVIGGINCDFSITTKAEVVVFVTLSGIAVSFGGDLDVTF